MQRCKEIVDKYSKNFIDLGQDNPHYGDDEGNNKEKVYKNLLNSKNVFGNLNSKYFPTLTGNNSNFDSLGQDHKLNKFDSYMISKLNEVSRKINSDIPNNYIVEDITVKIDMARIK